MLCRSGAVSSLPIEQNYTKITHSSIPAGPQILDKDEERDGPRFVSLSTSLRTPHGLLEAVSDPCTALLPEGVFARRCWRACEDVGNDLLGLAADLGAGVCGEEEDGGEDALRDGCARELSEVEGGEESAGDGEEGFERGSVGGVGLEERVDGGEERGGVGLEVLGRDRGQEEGEEVQHSAVQRRVLLGLELVERRRERDEVPKRRRVGLERRLDRDEQSRWLADCCNLTVDLKSNLVKLGKHRKHNKRDGTGRTNSPAKKNLSAGPKCGPNSIRSALAKGGGVSLSRREHGCGVYVNLMKRQNLLRVESQI